MTPMPWRVDRATIARTLPLVLFTLLAAPRDARTQAATPASWRWVTDRPARAVASDAVSDSAFHFVSMAPGWHITTGPGSTLFDPAHAADGRFSIEAQLILFPGESRNGYGMFVGGRDLEGASPRWLAFLIRRLAPVPAGTRPTRSGAPRPDPAARREQPGTARTGSR